MYQRHENSWVAANHWLFAGKSRHYHTVFNVSRWEATDKAMIQQSKNVEDFKAKKLKKQLTKMQPLKTYVKSLIKSTNLKNRPDQKTILKN